MTRSLLRWAMFLLLLKNLLAVFFPVIGDEAYYFYWGRHAAGGYYDLPPMIGWWLIPFSKVSMNSLWLRLPNLISAGLIALGIYEWLKEALSKERAMMIAGLFFFLPLPFLAVLMFPDVPLLLFGFCSALLFYRGAYSRSKISGSVEFLLSGALWGAAFLSKYFAVFFLPAYVLWYLFQKRKSWLHVFAFTLGAIPFLFQHLYWNQNHCWANFVFNLVSRQKANDGTVAQTFGFFVLYLGLVSTPFLWKSLFGRVGMYLDASLEANDRLKELDRFFFLLWSVPVAIFGLTALMGKGQGLHWLLFLTPYFAVTIGLRILEDDLEAKLKDVMGLSAVLTIVLLLALLIPDWTVKPFLKNRNPFDYQLVFHPEEFLEAALPKIEKSDAIFTEGYTFSSVLDHDLRVYERAHRLNLPDVSVWGSGSRFGRVFDWTTDWNKLEGKTLAIITPKPIDVNHWSTYFSSVEATEPRFTNQTFYILFGTGFKAQLYKEQEFKPGVHPFYPPFLPGVCSLKD